MIEKEHEVTQTSTEPTNSEKPSNPKFRQKRTSLLIAVVALLLAAIAASGVFYTWQQLQIDQQRKSIQINNLQKKLAHTNLLLKQQDSAFQAEQRNLKAFLQKNQQQQGSRLLIEINDLVKLAAFHLTFDNNLVVARQLLEVADRQITTDNNPAFWPLRQVLAQDIAMLEAAPTVDLPGLVARLGALSRETDELPKLPLTVSSQKNDILLTSETNPTLSSSPSDKLNVLWNKLKHFMFAIGDTLANMVIVSKDNQVAPTLLTPEQRIYIVTNIQSQLTLAEWAAIHRQESIYQQSLEQAENWLQRFFSGDNPLTQSILKTIVDLKKISVNPIIPDISRSLDALQSMKKEVN